MKLYKAFFYFIIFFNTIYSNHNPEIAPNLFFHSTKETLATITTIISQQQKGMYLRFGDGDINLVTGRRDALQQYYPQIQKEMCEAFGLNGSTILKTLPIHCPTLNTCEKGMFRYNHEQPYERCLSFLQKVKPFWGGGIQDVYSPVALHYVSVYDPDYCVRFLHFLKQHCTVFIGNEKIPASIRELLFGPQCAFIRTLSNNAYTKIDAIEQKCLGIINKIDGYNVIITVMGCSGRVLQKRLWQKLDNVFLFDFGNLMDALCGWMRLGKFKKERKWYINIM